MQDEVVVVTGGSSGIGLATAAAFRERGARVWITARNREKLEDAAATLDGVSCFPSDVTRPETLTALAERIRDREGRCDVLVNSAGQLELAPAAESAAIAERLIQSNYLGVVNTVAAFLPLLRAGERRSIVNLSSFVGRLSPPYFAAYSASKHALQAYSHALRQELAPEGISVSLVLPGPVESPMTEDRLRTPMYPIPLGVPILTPDQVADAILESVFRRARERSVPKYFSPLLRLGSALPAIVDRMYRSKLI